MQQLYNNLNDTRNISFLLDENKRDDAKLDEPKVSANNSATHSGGIQPQDIANQDQVTETPDAKPVDPNEGNIVIEGLENFSFTDTPEEEI